MASELLLALAAMAGTVTATPTLEDFEATLRRHDSATLALEEWCTMRGLADPAHVTAQTLANGHTAPPTDLSAVLGLASDEALALRNVRLSCGGTVLSVAWNWYVPSRLTAPMNEALARSDAPFGKVVAPLGFRRKAISTVAGPRDNCPADTISTHQAMLMLPDGRPLAYLVECYTAANLAPLR